MKKNKKTIFMDKVSGRVIYMHKLDFPFIDNVSSWLQVGQLDTEKVNIDENTILWKETLFGSLCDNENISQAEEKRLEFLKYKTKEMLIIWFNCNIVINNIDQKIMQIKIDELFDSKNTQFFVKNILSEEVDFLIQDVKKFMHVFLKEIEFCNTYESLNATIIKLKQSTHNGYFSILRNSAEDYE